MDNAGWRARHRARREHEQVHQRGPDGFYIPYEPQVQPMQEGFIGGFHPAASGPPPPPREHHHHLHLPSFGILNASFERITPDATHPGYAPSYAPVYPPTPAPMTIAPEQIAHMDAVGRSQVFKVARMNPHLQFMCGPLLRYDTITPDNVWRGFALVVTADAGSIYEPHPMLTYEFDPDRRVTLSRSRATSYDLGPHPADPTSMVIPLASGIHETGPNAQVLHVRGKEIWVYAGVGGTYTFWRFAISVPLGPHEMKVRYSINSGQQLELYVPARDQNMRWAAYSCNGFSAGVNPDTFCGPAYKSGYDPVWVDLLQKHSQRPFHALVGGGDQLYCDGVTREPELQAWVTAISPAKKREMALTEEIATAIDRYYFNHYCQHFRSGAFARANCSIPMMNMLDDHDLIDGFGSYPEDLQVSPIFRHIGSRGYFFFLLFQCFINVDVDGLNDRQHSNRSLIIGGPGPYVPFPSHSFLASMGPHVSMLLLDCRAERKKIQVCSQTEYDRVFDRLQTIPEGVEHLIVQVGIPIAYPRLVFLETALESKFNPLVALGKSGTTTAFSGFFNKFNADAELLDDLSDHWTAKSHKKERNKFIERLQGFAKERRIRVTFLSGDVHCAAVGVLKTLCGPKTKNKIEVTPDLDHRYMLNVVTSAIVNTPPPNGVLTMVGTLAGKTHKSMHYCDTDETMLPLFDKDTNGSSNKLKHIMGRRNWTSVNWDPNNGDIEFDIRVEIEKGNGVTKGYAARAPAPRWIPTRE